MAEDLKPLLVSVEANLNKFNKQMAQAATTAATAAKSIDKSFVTANDNISQSYDKTAKAATVSLGQQQAAAQNLHFQLHQIATTLAGGMSPFEVMAQQGFQVVDALEQAGKGAGIFTAIGGAVTKIINPLSLLTFGTIYLTGVAVDYFMKMAGGTAAAIKAIDDQIAHIDRMAKAYANSIPELKAYDDKLKEIKQHLEDMQDAAATKATQTGNVQPALTDLKKAVAELSGEMGILPAATIDKLIKIKNALDDMEHAAANGTLQVKDLADVYKQLDDIMTGIKDKSALGDLPAQLEKAKTKLTEVTKTARDAIDSTQKAADQDAQAIEKYTKAMNDLKAVTAASMTKAQQIEKDYAAAIAAATEEVNAQTRALHLRAAEIERNNQLTQLHNEAIQQLGGAAIGGDQSDIERIIGWIESGNRDLGYHPGGGPGVKGNNVSGRYQFMDATYLEAMREIPAYADPKVISNQTLLQQKNDPAIQKAAMDQILKDYGTILVNIGKDASDATNIYLLHLFGKEGGKQLLQADPKASAAGIVGAPAIAANKWVAAQGGTVGDVISAVRAKVAEADIKSGGGSHDYAATIANIEKETKAIEEENKAAGFLTDAYDEVTFAKEKAKKVTELTDAAQKQGLVVTDAEKKAIDEVASAYAKAAGQKAFYTKATENSKKQEQISVEAAKQHAAALAQLRDQFAQMAANFTVGFIEDLKNGTKAVDALKNSLSRLADQLLSMAVNTLFKNILNAVMPGAASIGGASSVMNPFQMHSGGVVGSGGARRSVSPFAFIGAPRMHGGGLAGDEIATILQRGETVLPRGYSAGGNTSISSSVGNISIDMSGTGAVAADSDSGKRFGEQVRKLIQHEMVAQSRPGGLLTQSGSAGRVAR